VEDEIAHHNEDQPKTLVTVFPNAGPIYCIQHLRMVTIYRVAKSCLNKLIVNFGGEGFDFSKL